MKAGTLKRQLFLRIVPTIFTTIFIAGLLAFKSSNREINRVYDAQLISNASVLWMLVEDEINEAKNNSHGEVKVTDIDFDFANQEDLNESADDYTDSRMFRIWHGDKIIIYSDTYLPESIPLQKTGFSELTYKGDNWRIYDLQVKHDNIFIEVGEKKKLRNNLVLNILLELVTPLLILIPIIGLLIWLGIGYGLSKIKYLVKEIRSRSPDDLSHLNINELPLDIQPLGISINQLLVKLENSFTAEKRFSDHAAHQLQTPLSVIKLQLQILQGSKEEQERISLIKSLVASTDKASKLINNLLTSARLSHQPISLDSISLNDIVIEVMAELGPLALKKNIKISLNESKDCQVRADMELLRLLVNNIIENAIKYTPKNGIVDVNIRESGDNCILSIEDNGPGISEKERKMVFERFYRIDTPEEEGNGLGLSIANEIIKRFSGNIALKTPDSGKGLLVEVNLPAA